MSVLMKLSSRGYCWYLALKIGKAVLAAPLFLVCLPLYCLLGAGLWIVTCFIEAGKTVSSVFMTAVDFWRRNWLSGFSRAHYKSLYRKSAQEPLPPVDAA